MITIIFSTRLLSIQNPFSKQSIKYRCTMFRNPPAVVDTIIHSVLRS